MSEFREPDAEAVSGPSPPPLASPHPSEGVAPPRVSAPADVAPVAAHRATVLVVDDDELMRQLQVMIVEDIGLLAIQAGSASEARLQIERHGDHIGLVLLDVHLPDGSGVQLCEAITGGEWEPMRSVPIVIVTADREEALVEDAFFAGSVRQFHKPFEPEQLQHVVRAHMNLT